MLYVFFNKVPARCKNLGVPASLALGRLDRGVFASLKRIVHKLKGTGAYRRGGNLFRGCFLPVHGHVAGVEIRGLKLDQELGGVVAAIPQVPR